MIGKIISHYRILEKLGEGGMGVVYKAEDTKLKRHLALKFLPTHLTADEEAKERFIQEAQAASALDHPNICTIYEINETADGQMFIAMAYYEGETLKQKIATGQFSTESIVDITSQIAMGLAKAHRHGIIHRDIKPANLIVTNEGLIKILDFGLAKLAGQARRTRTGTTLGTVAYMSPEQVRGEEVDQQTDIWSLGVVLYEMICGKLPFGGEYEQAILYAIVHEMPHPLVHDVVDLPENLQKVVDKAIAKDREARYQHIDELLAELKREKKSTAELVKSVTVKRKLFRQEKLKLAAFALACGAVLIVSAYLFNRQPAKHVIPTHKQLTFVGNATFPAISPDGQFIAYVTGQHKSEQKVMVQDLAGEKPLEIVQADYCEYPRWSPDGAQLVFCTYGRAKLLPRLGGNARSLDSGQSPCWSPDGLHVAGFISTGTINVTNTSTGETARLPLNKSFSWQGSLDWSPLGNRLTFVTQAPTGYTIWTIKIDGSEQQKVLEDSLALFSPRWSADGRAIYYLRSEDQTKDLMKVRISPETGKPKGSPEKLLAGLPFGGYFNLTRDNKRLLYTRGTSSQNLWLITLKGEGKNRTFETKPLTTGTLWANRPAISPDGKSVVFSIVKHSRANLFVMPLAGGPMQQLTYLNSYNTGAVWSPDGNEIAFGSTQDGISRVWRVNSNGGTPRPFLRSELSEDTFALTWSPGPDILYQRAGNRNYHFLNSNTEAERPLLVGELAWKGHIFDPRYSPDANSVAAYWTRGGSGIWLLSLKEFSQVFLFGGLVLPIKWSADTKWIYAWNPANKPLKILKVPVGGGKPQDIAVLSLEGDTRDMRIDMSPDEKQLVYTYNEEKSDVWLLENFDPENELDKPLAVPDLAEMKQLTYQQKGANLFRQKKYAEAEVVFRKGLELNNKHVGLVRVLGLSLYYQGRYSEAEEKFRRGLAINPGHLALLAGIRLAAFRNKNLALAKSYNEKYLEVVPERSEKVAALVDLGAISILQKDYVAAEKDLHQALVIDSTSALANLQMGYFFAEQGRYAEAKTFADKALAADSSFANYNLMAWVLVAGELDIDRSILLAEKALSAKPEDWQPTVEAYPYFAIPEYTLGLAYLKKGKLNKALPYLEQAAVFAPTRQGAQDALQAAKQKLSEMEKK